MKKKVTTRISMLIAIGLLFFARSVFALDAVYSDFLGKAIKGYDPVAYFTMQKAQKGDKQYQYEWKDATWYFSSEENRNLFVANPEKYAPQYGGYCAWAVSNGYTAKIDPNAWSIYEGKLYLNYNQSVQVKWVKDVPNNIAKADGHWPTLLAQ
ncbi:YHS domain-containing (seleno)protein [Vibrio sp. B1Z05]|uniref:YHS domain-containing (seleno)protein n=1 Tax=Vibrio sp. B1Z05 TaxID=2654980 RepID=UPI00128CAE55|nr:YHS domain-containing (seleno)protein [Vibrio sp. B1Z05]MPW36196.1 YHS domain-containing protein [Vibrio sp. B1Z05]